MIVCPGQRRPDNMGVKTYLQFSNFLSWDVANPRTTMPISTICLFQPVNFQPSLLHFAQIWPTSFSPFQISRLLSDYSFDGYPVLFWFARTIHSRSTIRKAFPYKCVCVWLFWNIFFATLHAKPSFPKAQTPIGEPCFPRGSFGNLKFGAFWHLQTWPCKLRLKQFKERSTTSPFVYNPWLVLCVSDLGFGWRQALLRTCHVVGCRTAGIIRGLWRRIFRGWTKSLWDRPSLAVHFLYNNFCGMPVVAATTQGRPR